MKVDVTGGEPDYERFAAIVKARIKALLRSHQQVSDLGGPSLSTLSTIVNGTWREGRRPVRLQQTLNKLDVGLDWDPGGARRALYYGDPGAAAQPEEPATPEPTTDRFLRNLFERIHMLTPAQLSEVSALTDGLLLDSREAVAAAEAVSPEAALRDDPTLSDRKREHLLVVLATARAVPDDAIVLPVLGYTPPPEPAVRNDEDGAEAESPSR